MQSDFVSEKSLKNFLKNKIIGKNLIVLESVGSTNDYLKNLGNDGCENGTVVLAREQTNGKGRLGRSWICKKDESLALSILLRPKMAPSEVSAITPLTGLAVCKALRKFTGMECKIKWPNDIIVGRKKLVGILTEMSAEFDAVDYVVIGVGINVSQADFPKTIADKATSILLESGKSIDKNKLSAFILEEIEKTFTEAPKAEGTNYRAGDTVIHKVFGKGMVVSAKPMSGDTLLEIAFEKVGTKKLMANFAKLKKE